MRAAMEGKIAKNFIGIKKIFNDEQIKRTTKKRSIKRGSTWLISFSILRTKNLLVVRQHSSLLFKGFQLNLIILLVDY